MSAPVHSAGLVIRAICALAFGAAARQPQQIRSAIAHRHAAVLALARTE